MEPKCVENRAKRGPKSIKNLSKIDAETDVGKINEKGMPGIPVGLWIWVHFEPKNDQKRGPKIFKNQSQEKIGYPYRCKILYTGTFDWCGFQSVSGTLDPPYMTLPVEVCTEIPDQENHLVS